MNTPNRGKTGPMKRNMREKNKVEKAKRDAHIRIRVQIVMLSVGKLGMREKKKDSNAVGGHNWDGSDIIKVK